MLSWLRNVFYGEKEQSLQHVYLLKMCGVHHRLYFLQPSAGSSVSVCINPWISVCLSLVLYLRQLLPKYVENSTYLARLFSLVQVAKVSLSARILEKKFFRQIFQEIIVNTFQRGHAVLHALSRVHE